MCCTPICCSTTLQKQMTESRPAPHRVTRVTLYILHKAALSKCSLWACLFCQVQSLTSYAYSMNCQVTKQFYSRRQVDTPSHDCRSLLLVCSSCLLAWLISVNSVLCSCTVSRPELGFALLVHRTSLSHHSLAAHVFRGKHLPQVKAHI